jgi:hypothetical protein
MAAEEKLKEKEKEKEKVPVAVSAVEAPKAKAAQVKEIRFAEDILSPAAIAEKAGVKDKKKKKPGKEKAEDGIRLKKAKRGGGAIIDEEGDEY